MPRPRTRARAGAPAGGQHGAAALRARRVAGGEARHQAAPGLEEAPPRHGRRHRPDRRVGADRQGCRRRLAGRSPARPGRRVRWRPFTGDGAFDRDDVYAEVAARHPDADVIVPPRSSAVPSEAAETAPTRRDRHLQAIAERGRMGWQRASGYNWRALVEADVVALEARDRRRAALADGRATGDRGGHRRRRAEPHAGPRTPGVRPHRMTRSTGRAQCAYTVDPCNTVGQRHLRLAHAGAGGEARGPALQGRALHRPGQDDVRGLVEQGPHPGVADLGDPPGHVRLPGLVPPGRQAEVRADRLRRAEPPGVIDRRDEGERHDGAHARRGHQQPDPLILPRLVTQALLQRAQLSPECVAGGQERLGHRGQRRMPLHQLADPDRKAPRRGRPDLQPEAAQHAPQAHLHVEALRLQQLARGQQRARLLRRQRLAVHRAEPPQPHQLRDAARVLAVGLHRHRLERVPHVPGLKQLHREPGLAHRRVQPLRQRTRLQADPRHLDAKSAEPGDQRLRLARHLRLAHDPPRGVHHAHAAQFQRDVDPGIVLHGRPSMMLGAGPRARPRPRHHQSEGRPPSPPTPAAGPLPHLGRGTALPSPSAVAARPVAAQSAASSPR